MKALKKTSPETGLLLFVLAVAAAIRCWDFSSMQYMHDELSAIIRSQAGSFSEVIYKTKTTDVHPVFVPIFVHYWTKLFGTSEATVRLPFILCGLASIYYSYKIAEKWFNPTVAILTSAFLASLQFPTMYGQLERPYATGMLFSVLMVWCWTQFFLGEKTKNKYAIGFVVFASLCTYNHYFSLLFAAVVATTGFLFLNNENGKKYFLMCFAVILLFIPHISILLFQLSTGSGGEESWLGRPHPDWLITFLKYLFHYSQIVYLMVAGIIGASFYFREKEKKVFDKMRMIALVWALLVPLWAYFFSILKTPVLQFSTFTFSLPFLLMFLFSFYEELKMQLKTPLIAIVLSINYFTLFYFGRNHWPVFYKQPYEEMAIVGNAAVAQFGEKNVSVSLSAMPGFVDFYFTKYGKKFNYFRVEQSDTKAFLEFIEKEKTNYFVAGNLPPEYYQIVKERYPYIVQKEQGFTYSVYCFSKTKLASEIKEQIVFTKKIQTSKIVLDSTKEYGPEYNVYFHDILKSRHSIINVSAEMRPHHKEDSPTLVMEISDSKGLILWRGSDYNQFIKSADGPNKVYLSYLFSGLDLKEHPYAKMKVYVWNRDKKNIEINSLDIEVIESNPVIYGLYETIE